MGADILASAKGLGGQLHVFRDRVRITRRGFLGALGGQGDTEILLQKIAAVRFKRAGMGRGFIQFAFPGSLDTYATVDSAGRDPNSVVFNGWQQKQFEQARATVETLLAEARAAAEPSFEATSAGRLDQLERLAELRSRGILTEAEFLSEKRKILGP